MRTRLERYFEFDPLGTNWRTEILAGFTTFITMAYIILVNPAILQETGMPFQAVVAATCLSAAVGSILMGMLARCPIALAPGMGLNAYFTYTVCKGMGVPWQVALGAVVPLRCRVPAVDASGRSAGHRRGDRSGPVRNGRSRHWPLHRLHRTEERRPGCGASGDAVDVRRYAQGVDTARSVRHHPNLRPSRLASPRRDAHPSALASEAVASATAIR